MRYFHGLFGNINDEHGVFTGERYWGIIWMKKEI